MPRQPSREKVARYRLRQAGELQQLPTCPECGRNVISTTTLPLCSRCWRKSPDGRAADAARKRRARKRDEP
jgi:transposase-like protein